MNYNIQGDGRGGSVGSSISTKPTKNTSVKTANSTKDYDRSQLSKKELSDNYVATAMDVMNEVFVVEGGTCECNKGIDPAEIMNTQAASTSFGGKKALTVSCVKMQGEIFGACKKLTEENDKKKGKKCPPIMCKGKFNPVPDKWLDPVTSVSSNGEEVIAVYSKLKCEHGGTIHITRNGQGGLYDQGYVNFEVSKELAWTFTPFAASGYQLYTGRNMNDWSVMTKTETGIQVVFFTLDGIAVFSKGKNLLNLASKGDPLAKGSKVAINADKIHGFDYLDNQLGNMKHKVKINKYESAESVNNWWKVEKGYENAPYTSKTVVQDITLLSDETFVRVYDGEVSGLKGGWLMKADDIKGLSPKQIKEKFALPAEPIYIGEVTIPKGSSLRVSSKTKW